MQMKRLGFHAKNIIAAGYDPVSGILAVQFKSGTYQYSGVPEAKYASLCRVPYPDSYYTKAIKGQYPVTKVSDGKEEGSTSEDRKVLPQKQAPVRTPEDGMGGDGLFGVHGSAPQDGAVLRPLRGVVQQESRQVMEFYREQDGLKFQEEGHIYTLNGNRVISLTQILDAAGLVNYDGIAPEVLANKAKFGTKVHTYCLWNDQGELDMNDLVPYPNYWNRVEGWRQFVDDFKFQVTLDAAEKPCAVKVNGMLYAMTIDRLGMMDGKPAIVEIKTCADREFHHQIQTAAQAIPMNEFFKDKGGLCKRYAVYLLDKKNQANRFYFAAPHEDRMDEKVFMASLVLTQTRINNKLLKGF